jgi:spore germination protein KA
MCNNSNNVKTEDAFGNIQYNVNLTMSLEDNINIFKQIFINDDTLTYRKFENNKNCLTKFCMIYIDYMVNSTILNQYILKPIMNSDIVNAQNNFADILYKNVIESSRIKKTSDINEIVKSLISGSTALLIDNCEEILIIDTIGFETRSIEEPLSEGVVMGPREGFIESLKVNLSLIRRRVQNPDLKFKFKELGTRTKTNICICYIEGLAQEKILQELYSRLNKIQIDGIIDSNYIEELITDSPFSFIKTINSTERPDVVVSRLLEGRIAIVCDGTPFVLTLPCIFLERFQASEDYYNNYLFASFNRLIRWSGFFLSTSTPAMYIALVNFHQELIPTQLLISISASRQGVAVPTLVEVLIMTLTFELLREAGTRIPKPIGQAVSIVGALILGDAAVNARFISAPIVIVTALTGISSFLIPQFTGVLPVRIIFLIMTSFLGLYGYIFALIAVFLYLTSLRSFGVPFMLNSGTGAITFQDLKDTSIRVPQIFMKKRPKLISNNLKRQNSDKEGLK